MNGKEFCRLCLNEVYVASSNNANLSDLQTREILTSIFTDMNTALTNAVKLCEDCFNNVNFIMRVRQGFLLKNKEHLQKKGHESYSRQYCRLCFRLERPFNMLLHEGNYSAEVLKQTIDIALSDCKFTHDMAICGACWCWIKKIFHFKRRCFNMEENLKFYCAKKKVHRLNDSDLEDFLTEQYYIRVRSEFEREATSAYPKVLPAPAPGIVQETINLVDDESEQPDVTHTPYYDEGNSEDKIDICENKLENPFELSSEDVIVIDGDDKFDDVDNIVLPVEDEPKENENDNNNNNNLWHTASFYETIGNEMCDNRPEFIELCALNPNLPQENFECQRSDHAIGQCLPRSSNGNSVLLDNDCYEVIDEPNNIIDLTNIDCYVNGSQAGDGGERVTSAEKVDLWGCHVCVAIFTRKSPVRKHLLSHEDPWNKYGRFECRSCPFRANWKGSVTRHKFHHTKKVRNKFAGKKLKYLCPYCDVTYMSRGNMQSHMQEHVISWKQFQCIDCMFTANVSESLRLHYRVYHCKKKDPSFS